MREYPSLKNSPNTPKKSNMTLYEMAQSMSETSDAQEAFPYLVKWLMKEFWTHYQFNGMPYSDEYAYNIAYFTVYNFINREICNSKPEVFRTKFLKEIVKMNLDRDFYNVLASLKDATVELTRNIKTTDSNTNNSDGVTTRDLSGSVDETVDSTGKNTLTHATSDVTDSTNKTTGTSNGTNNKITQFTNTETLNTKTVVDDDVTLNTNDTTTVDSTNDITKNDKVRNVLTDYPQSTVNTTIVGSWNYASGAQDTENNGTEKDVNKSTTSEITNTTTSDDTTTTNTGTVTNANNGTDNNTTSSSNTEDVTGKTTLTKSGTDTTDLTNKDIKKSATTDSGTVSFENNSTDNRNIEVAETWKGITGLELNAKQIELFDQFKSFYNTLLLRLENCFISIYIDEDRDGYLDPSVNLMGAWNS